MDCTIVREAVSATLDGEAAGVSHDLLAHHLQQCHGCSVWASGASVAHRRVRVVEAEVVPDLTAGILAAIGHDADVAPSGLRGCRIVLAACALLQLIACLPVLFATSTGPIHLDHELGSWDAALAMGLLFAAFYPQRAWGMFPLVAAVVGALTVTGIVDVVSGHTTLAAESNHIMEIVGLCLLWGLARLQRPRRADPAFRFA